MNALLISDKQNDNIMIRVHVLTFKANFDTPAVEGKCGKRKKTELEPKKFIG
jgi:hypothetical protein